MSFQPMPIFENKQEEQNQKEDHKIHIYTSVNGSLDCHAMINTLVRAGQYLGPNKKQFVWHIGCENGPADDLTKFYANHFKNVPNVEIIQGPSYGKPDTIHRRQDKKWATEALKDKVIVPPMCQVFTPFEISIMNYLSTPLSAKDEEETQDEVLKNKKFDERKHQDQMILACSNVSLFRIWLREIRGKPQPTWIKRKFPAMDTASYPSMFEHYACIYLAEQGKLTDNADVNEKLIKNNPEILGVVNEFMFCELWTTDSHIHYPGGCQMMHTPSDSVVDLATNKTIEIFREKRTPKDARTFFNSFKQIWCGDVRVAQILADDDMEVLEKAKKKIDYYKQIQANPQLAADFAREVNRAMEELVKHTDEGDKNYNKMIENIAENVLKDKGKKSWLNRYCRLTEGEDHLPLVNTMVGLAFFLIRHAKDLNSVPIREGGQGHSKTSFDGRPVTFVSGGQIVVDGNQGKTAKQYTDELLALAASLLDKPLFSTAEPVLIMGPDIAAFCVFPPSGVGVAALAVGSHGLC